MVRCWRWRRWPTWRCTWSWTRLVADVARSEETKRGAFFKQNILESVYIVLYIVTFTLRVCWITPRPGLRAYIVGRRVLHFPFIYSILCNSFNQSRKYSFFRVPFMAGTHSSPSVAAMDSVTSPASLTSTAPAATTVAASSSTSSPPFVFGTPPSLFSSNSSAVTGSQFAPLFSFATTTPPPPAPRLSIYNDHISNHIKFLLNPADHNYHKWKSFFLMVLIRHGVKFLIEHPPPPNADAAYLELDAHVVLWIYATLADSMVDHVVGATNTFALWHKIKDFFLANRAARFMILNRQYRNLKQGDLPVAEYARRMKLLTDGLADIEHAVTEVDLRTQFLHGLDKRLDTIRVVLGDQELPFDTVLSRVILAEESQEQRAAEESASAFVLPGGDHGQSGGSGGGARGSGSDRSKDRAQGHLPHQQQHAPGRGRADRSADGGDRGRGRGRGWGDQSGRGSAPQLQFSPFTGYFAPYGMALPSPRSGWVPPNAAGVLGPRPGFHAQAYPMYQPAPPPPSYPLQPPSWEHLAMLNAAYSNSGFPTTPGTEWFLDSSASSHVTGSQGSTHSESSHDLR
ncbi:uncharacterized protein LOC119279615 [Triticum dicoccoides]|uniref:uncharacterized protein LOC119279615 n=1 Tax=Triticum dicoccoides TaxID=85692 RepID=UPI0018906CC6|nr:uncharacterized protein LOC119279615 [Triticum dicoccoides]